MSKKIKLSIVILSYNTKDLLRGCLKSLEKVGYELSFEVIVVDNASVDGSAELVKKDFPKVRLFKNRKNLGFAAGNNKARKVVRGEFVLFLNPDTVVKKNTFKETVKYLKSNKEVGAMTCKIVLPSGELDKDARRSFPTPWVSLTHLVLRLDKLFPKSKLLSRYWYGYKSPNETHEVDVIQGAYFLTRKKVLDSVGWFDEDYFLDGEDIDLCWKIKERGWKIIYYPKVSITHVKKASKMKPVSKEERVRFIKAGVDSMEIFYKKRLWKNYPLALNLLVIVGTRLVKAMRAIKVLFN